MNDYSIVLASFTVGSPLTPLQDPSCPWAQVFLVFSLHQLIQFVLAVRVMVEFGINSIIVLSILCVGACPVRVVSRLLFLFHFCYFVFGFFRYYSFRYKLSAPPFPKFWSMSSWDILWSNYGYWGYRWYSL